MMFDGASALRQRLVVDTETKVYGDFGVQISTWRVLKDFALTQGWKWKLQACSGRPAASSPSTAGLTRIDKREGTDVSCTTRPPPQHASNTTQHECILSFPLFLIH